MELPLFFSNQATASEAPLLLRQREMHCFVREGSLAFAAAYMSCCMCVFLSLDVLSFSAILQDTRRATYTLVQLS